MGKELRRSIRVRIKKGQVLVYDPSLPTLYCLLLDLGEGGMRCRTHLSEHHLDESIAIIWRRQLHGTKQINVEILAPGQARSCKFKCDIRHVKLDYEGEIEFGLKFDKLDVQQQEVLKQSMRLFEGIGKVQPDAPPVAAKAIKSETKTVKQADAPLPVPQEEPPPAKPRASSSSQRLTAIAQNVWGRISGGKKSEAPAAAQKTASSSISGGLSKNTATLNFRGMKLGEILVRSGRLTEDQISQDTAKANSDGMKLGRYLLSARRITPFELCRALSLQSGLPIVDLGTVTPPGTVMDIFEADAMSEYQFVPFNKNGDTVFIACAQPLTKKIVADLERASKHTLKVFLAQDDAVSNMFYKHFAAPPPAPSPQE